MWWLSLPIVVCGACLLESKIKKILTISLGKNIGIVSNNENKRESYVQISEISLPNVVNQLSF